eukprot:CAMPEP_0183712014 /NCGR_PEP_ID=MMETSP0737-20130205/7299_1 /TAXON_ID=385413 /ORGANISM="Thalassiosira miniscula, Strain CCMP1093" /LENGTH=825 /DNA_ID=CAMNT_0025940589 /DNA_START=493 /DNA_END=2970 /DNA_ORIENTATION=+
MIKTGLFASMAAPYLVGAADNSNNLRQPTNNDINNAHPAAGHDTPLRLHPQYRSHLKCPYAEQWLAKGPERAARDLGLDSHGRKLEEDIKGSCGYTDTWSGQATCLQFNGAAWTSEDMASKCASQNGEWSADGCGAGGEEVFGWCDKMISEGKHEATLMGDCDGSKMACESFMGGTFLAGDACAATASEQTGESSSVMSGGPPPGVMAGAGGGGGGGGPPPGVTMGGGSAKGEEGDPAKCIIAPGAIGAAHQAGFSKGYSSSCPNSPAQESPYMWPMKWTAETHAQAMVFESDEVVYESKGRVFYMLDKNWKRSDVTYQVGALRALGTGDCEDSDTEELFQGGGCLKNQTDGTVSTMIHRGGQMYFIEWEKDETNPVKAGETDASKVARCDLINLAVVGNIRPDWFLDKRGDDTDVQYLGNQHVYYASDTPKLVKQWRKRDFASQYFTMSVMENPPNKLAKDPDAPTEDKMNWPLILNVPGEGLGDDQLYSYRNHELLTDDDEDLFTIIDRYEAMGNACVDIRAGGEGNGQGAPEGGHIPSNLEVDPLSWVSKEITFSPIWSAPVKEDAEAADLEEMMSPADPGKSVMEVSDRVTVGYCYDEASSSVDMSVHFHVVEPTADGKLPWMAMGYRPTKTCSMTPPDGSSTPIVLMTQSDEESTPEAHTTMLTPAAKSFQPDVFAAMMDSATLLTDSEEYSNIVLDAPMVSSNAAMQIARSSSAPEDTVSLHFKQVVENKPEVMHLMYAIGLTSQLGSHITRKCFELEDIPSCSTAGTSAADVVKDEGDENVPADGMGGAAAQSAAASFTSAGIVIVTLCTLAVVAIGF